MDRPPALAFPSEPMDTAATMPPRAPATSTREELYRSIVEQLTDGIVLIETKDLGVIECNEAFSSLLGCSSIEEARSLTAYDISAAGRDEIHKIVHQLVEHGTSMHSERTFRRRDGSLVPVDVTASVIEYGAGHVLCVTAKDISARKAAEKEIGRLAVVAQKTQNSVVVCDPNGYVQWVNAGFTRLSGYEPDEIIGKSPLILCGEETDPETLSRLIMAVGERRPFEGELFYYKKDGTGYWVSVSLMPLTDGNDSLEGYISLEMDITERKAMEEKLRRAHEELELRITDRTRELVEANRSMRTEAIERNHAEAGLRAAQQFLRSVIDNIPNLVTVKDADGKFTLVNRAAAEMYGSTVENMIGRSLADFSPSSDDIERIRRCEDEVRATNSEKVVPEEKFTNKNGETRWFQSVTRPLVIGEHCSPHVLTIAVDMTERKVLEGQLQHSQKMESIGQLAAGIAHEINTPTQYVGDNTRFIRDAFDDINSVLGKYAELLRFAEEHAIEPKLVESVKQELATIDLEYLQEEVPSAIKQALDGVSRIAKIVQSMKEFAHPGSREKQSAEINRAIESTITVARNEWKYVADVEMKFDQELPMVPCFLGEFNQVILNMVINAAHAITDVVGDGSQGKGKITVTTTRASDEWAEVRIADTGKGIPAGIRDRIFDPFFTTKEVGRGSGQGLAISHAVIVERHGGRLSFETEEGKGTTFIIRLPLAANLLPHEH